MRLFEKLIVWLEILLALGLFLFADFTQIDESTFDALVWANSITLNCIGGLINV